MKRAAFLIYGVLSYVIFFGVFLYAIGFIGNIWVPKSIDAGPQVPLLEAALTNIGLLALFAVQHSGMARPTFKHYWTRIVPPVIERSTYVLLSSVCLGLLFLFWQPMGGVIWEATGWGQTTFYTLYGAGWLLVLWSTFLINHFDLFGLSQVYNAFKGNNPQPLKFVTPSLYRIVRHPLYVGWILVVWMTPVMTVAHLLFALGCTGYILAAIQLEERNLAEMHSEYAQYKRKVPMLVPSLRRRLSTGDVEQAPV